MTIGWRTTKTKVKLSTSAPVQTRTYFVGERPKKYGAGQVMIICIALLFLENNCFAQINHQRLR